MSITRTSRFQARIPLTLCLVVMWGVASSHAAQPITTASLIREMTDLGRLTEFPDPAYETIQFSSYDRRSKFPGGPGWFSNADGFGREPIPNFEAVLIEPDDNGIGEYLICDIDAPGAIVRCWTAAINGSIRVYLDDQEEPVFDGSADDFLRRPYDAFAAQVGIDPTIFDDSFNQQNASYCPIPFAKRCRILWIGNLQQVHFYEVQVRVYEPDAQVQTFSPQDLVSHAALIERTAQALREPSRVEPERAQGAATTAIDVRLESGESKEFLVAHDGPRAFTSLQLRVDPVDFESEDTHQGAMARARLSERILRQTMLRVWFDDHASPQIEAPLGDFFGAAPGINPFDATPFAVSKNGTLKSRWIMPYAKSVQMSVENLSDQPVHVTGQADHGPYTWNEDRSMHLYALWRVDHDLIADPASPQDIPFIMANGRGRYVGTASILLNPTDIPTPGGGWWGEGDEKIFVDDDVHPSTYGTGSEDYYNYAWSIPDIFGFAYCGQPRNDGPGNRGFVTNHRWHIVDDLPFNSGLAFFMELWPHARTPGFSYARLSYFYGRPGVVTDHPPMTPADVRTLELSANWTPLAAGGARNSEFIEPESALEPTGFRRRTRPIRDNLFSAGQCSVWQPDSAFDMLNFTFSVSEDARYSADLCVLMTDDFGRIRVWIDGQDKLATEADLNSPGRRILRRIRTQPLDLPAGEHTLRVQSIDPEHKAVGIDFLWIQKR